jgi:coniferyl-aldehyde dehydrogenase
MPPSLGPSPAVAFARLREAHRRDGAPSYDQRRSALTALEDMVRGARHEIASALDRDFGGRSRHESLLGDVLATVNDARYARRNLRAWMRRRRVPAGPAWPSRAEIVCQPLGVVGILAPWNFPVQLAFGPLVPALAAGNRVLLKPSEMAPATSSLIAELVEKNFSGDHVAVVTGGAEVGESLARLPLDHLLFTGSARVGRRILHAASENLVPVTLELGGKSPVIVGASYPVDAAAQCIMRAKLLNAGQTCVTPDYALVPEHQAGAFARACGEHVARMYPRILDNPDYTAIINERHLQRLRACLEDARAKGAEVVEINPLAERLDGATRKLAPTIVSLVTDDMVVMQEEIFGPILPIRTYASLDEALAYVNDRPRPLALYCFSRDGAEVRRVCDATVSGGVTINETMLHGTVPELPFGGVGQSGMGRYHGRHGFETFSHQKPVLHTSRFNLGKFMQPPYGRFMNRLIKALLGGS